MDNIKLIISNIILWLGFSISWIEGANSILRLGVSIGALVVTFFTLEKLWQERKIRRKT